MANGGGHVNRKNSKLLKLIGIHILAVAVVIPNYISRILAGGFGTAKSSDRNQASAFHPSSNIFPVFCEEGIYGIWNCPFPVEQYFYYGGFHHSYTGSCMPSRIQL